MVGTNIEDSPYAEWLEGVCKTVMTLKPDSIGLVATGLGNGMALTAYYEADAGEKAEMMSHLMSDFIMDIIKNNAEIVRNCVMDAENDEDDTDDDEVEEEEEWQDE